MEFGLFGVFPQGPEEELRDDGMDPLELLDEVVLPDDELLVDGRLDDELLDEELLEDGLTGGLLLEEESVSGTRLDEELLLQGG